MHWSPLIVASTNCRPQDWISGYSRTLLSPRRCPLRNLFDVLTDISTHNSLNLFLSTSKQAGQCCGSDHRNQLFQLPNNYLDVSLMTIYVLYIMIANQLAAPSIWRSSWYCTVIESQPPKYCRCIIDFMHF
jgi:hypothetical protein